jgi:molecular chaperone GrpE
VSDEQQTADKTRRQPSLWQRFWSGVGGADEPDKPEEETAPSTHTETTVEVTTPAHLKEQMRLMQSQLDDVRQHVESLVRSQGESGANTSESGVEATLLERLEALEKQITRAGREQFKANSLAEQQNERTSEALEMLRTAEARRDDELVALHQQMEAARVNARLEVVQALLPALDGIDEALRSGREVLRRPVDVPPMRSFWGGRNKAATQAVTDAVQMMRETLDAWLVGLTFIRQRLLDVLSAEDVRPIEAEQQPFDPRLHVVLDVVAAREDLPPGTVATELRRGYLVGTRVLRHAEVVVARPAESDEEASAGAAIDQGQSEDQTGEYSGS